jgi:aspartate aminotransferase
MATAAQVTREIVSENIQRLSRARNVLGGFDEAGIKAHPSMFDAEVISFAHGEGVRRPHPLAVRACVRALLDTVESSLDNYLFLRSFPALESRISADFVRQGIDKRAASNVVIESGTTRLACAWLHAISRPQDIFLTAPTFYHPLAKWCQLFGAALMCVPTQRGNQYKLTRNDLEEFLRTIRRAGLHQPRGLFVFNPTQTGAIYDRCELEAIADFILKNDLVVLEDRIFARTEYDGRPSPALGGVNGMADHVVSLDGGSKAFSLANIRIGWGCGPEKTMKAMADYSTATSATIPHLAKAMALAALEAPEAYLAGNRIECQQRALFIRQFVHELNIRLELERLSTGSDAPWVEIEHMPAAGHSMLLSLNRLVGLPGWGGLPMRDSIDVTRYLLSSAKVAVSPGWSCGFSDCKVRMCFGCVGLEHTYPETRSTEALYALAGLLPFLNFLSSELRTALQFECESAEYNAMENEGFQKGRSLIREALLERMFCALLHLGKRKENLERQKGS